MYPFTAELRLVLLATILAATLIGWLALWAAAGRFRWYWHAAPLTVALAALVPMGGRDPILLFGVQAGTIVMCETVRKRMEPRGDAIRLNASLKFGLHDAIAMFALVGALLAIVRIRPEYAPPHATMAIDRWTYSGAGLGLATLAGSALVCSREKLWRRLLVALLFMAAAAGLLLFNDLKDAAFPYSLYGASGIQWSYDWVLVLVPTQAAVTAVWLMLLKGAGWAWWPAEKTSAAEGILAAAAGRTPRPTRWLHPVSRIAVILSTAWLVWVTATVYWQLLPQFSVPTVALPTPNGADDLLSINRKIQWNSLPGQDIGLATEQQCGQFATDNEPQLEAIRAMLAKPWWHTADYADLNKALQFVQSTRNSSFALWADARAQAAQGRYDLAAQDYLDMMLLANLSTRGGINIGEYMADAIAGIAHEGLIDHLDQFDPQALREIAYTIELLEGVREPIEKVQARDALQTAIMSNWMERLVDLAGRVSRGPGGTNSELQRARCDAKSRLIAIEAALRAHEAEHGAFPDALDALVPRYFKTLPIDPFYQYEEAPFIYRRDGDRYLLYSVGFDGYDDGGLQIATRDPRRGEKQDVFIDSRFP